MLEYEIVRKVFEEARPVQAGSGLEYIVNCRHYHKKGGVGKMYINAESGLYYCQDCEAKGNAEEEFFFNYTSPFPSLGREPEEIMRHVGTVFAKRGENNVQMPGEVVKIKDLPINHPAWVYLLEERKFDYQEICALEPGREIFYCVGQSHNGYGRRQAFGRLVFRITSGGSLRAWQARTVERGISKDLKEVWNGKKWKQVGRLPNGKWENFNDGKYIFSLGAQKSQLLYGMDAARSVTREAVIVEGVLDALRVGPQAIVTFGLISIAQKRMIKSYFDSVVLLVDPEIEVGSDKWKTWINDWDPLTLTATHLPNGKDPGETERGVIWSTIEQAKFKKRAGDLPLY